MMNDLTQIARQREQLTQQLSAIRRASMLAARTDDFRAVARLTIEAARINRSIVESDTQADMAR